jgi:translation initiation factor 2 beta subunit (eIF-2beta)/eIF-5
MNIGAENNDPFYRYKRPCMEIVHSVGGGGQITKLVNLMDVAKSVNRDCETLAKWLSLDLNSQCKHMKKYDMYVVSGHISKVDVEHSIDTLIEEYVLCKVCSNPETTFNLSKGKRYLKCKACGQKSELEENKFTNFIFK